MLKNNVFQNTRKRFGFLLAIVGATLTISWNVMADCSTTCKGSNALNTLPCGGGQYAYKGCCCWRIETKGPKLQDDKPLKGKK